MSSDALGPFWDALADRYTPQRELGRGGNAVVYLAHDARYDRLVAIKVLEPELGRAVQAERFLREIQIAAQVSHPHILPLLDSGEAGGVLFYVMPYVSGESLRDRLNRDRQLPLADVVTLGSEVADALEHAHAHGIVHRDIKPENILLQAGHAVVADFGIARALTVAGERRVSETGVSLGTPAYMSPEQAGADPHLDHRSDVYSLACVLYETLVGHPPFVGGSMQEILARHMVDPVPSIRVVRSAVPEAVENVIVRALSKAPADRYGTAAEFANALTVAVSSPTPARRRPPLRRILAGAMAAVLVGLLAYWLGRPKPLLGFARRDWVVIADFQFPADQMDVARALNLALSTGLQQSPHVNVLSRTRIATVFEFMKRPPGTLLDEAVAREVAQRVGGVKAVIVPELATVGGEFLMSLRVVEPAAGDVVASFSSRALQERDLLDALDALIAELRRALGESLLALRQSPRLPAVTTGSMDALKRFAAGRRAWFEGRHNDALALFQEAIALDSTFASAHAALGNAYASFIFRDYAKGRASFEAAIRHLDRMGPRERNVIQAMYHSNFGNKDDAIRFYGMHLELYPDDLDIRYNLGGTYRARGDCPQAVEQYREVLRLDPQYAQALVNTAICLPKRESIAYWRKAFEVRPQWEAAGNLNHEFGMTLATIGDRNGARAVFEKRLQQAAATERANAHRSLGQLDLLAGHFALARAHFEQAVPLHYQSQEPPSAARDRMWLAIGETTRGDTASAIRALRQASTEMPLTEGWVVLRTRLARVYVSAGGLAAASAMLNEITAWSRGRAELDEARSEPLLLEADILLAQGQPDSALVLLGPVAGAGNLSAPRALPRARAYEQTQRWAEAAVSYRSLIDNEMTGYEGLVPWVVAHYRLGLIYERLGQRNDAKRFLGRFSELWSDADAEVRPLVADARARLERLDGAAPASRP